MSRKKTCVEDCLRLSANRIAQIAPTSSAVLTWRRDGEKLASISISRAAEFLVILSYSVNGEPLEYPVSLNTTPLPWDAKRYWFSCPCCQKRVAHLYIPSGAKIFVCRHCYNLTYKSAQTENKWRKLFKMVDRLIG